MNCPFCNVHIDEHPANACFNAWVAEYIFGDEIWTNRNTRDYNIIWEQSREFEPGRTTTIPLVDYTGDIACAWEVIGKMEEKGFWFSLVYKSSIFKDDLNKAGWSAQFRCVRGGTRGDHFGVSVDAAHAICRVAIKATQG